VFDRDVRGCAWSVTVGDVGVSFPAAVFATPTRDEATPDGIVVRTSRGDGAIVDGTFHVSVACGAPKQHFAVVDVNALLASSGVVRQLRTRTGPYVTIFPQDSQACVAVASVTAPGDDPIVLPSAVSLGDVTDELGRHGVEVHTGDVFGTPAERPIHVVMTC